MPNTSEDVEESCETCVFEKLTHYDVPCKFCTDMTPNKLTEKMTHWKSRKESKDDRK